jgi:7-cyano-7-deazaguanine reductase
MDLLQRRGHLAVFPNPDPAKEYIATIEGKMEAGKIEVALRYVPDRDILDPVSFAAYLDVLGHLSWDSLEKAAVTIIDDINNEVVPRWARVVLSVTSDDAAAGRHSVLLEDSQPKWDNPALISRLKLY